MEQRQLEAQQFLVVGRQVALESRATTLHAQQSIDSIVVELRRGIGLRLQRRKVRARAEVTEQQEAFLEIGFENARCIEPHGLEVARDAQEWQAILVLGRCIHHDETAPAFLQAKVAPETRIRGRRRRLAARDSVDAIDPSPQRSEPGVVRTG